MKEHLPKVLAFIMILFVLAAIRFSPWFLIGVVIFAFLTWSTSIATGSEN